MTELLDAIAAETVAAGHATELVLDRFPQLRADGIYVVVPHEFHAWGDRAGFPDANQRSRTIALCTENPGTEWFEATWELVPEFAAAVSINGSSAQELRRRGVRCEHIQLGYSPLWDSWHGDDRAEREIDVLYLGAADPRRDPLLAGLGRELCVRSCQFLVPPLELRTRPRPDFLKGADKYRRLRSSKILLNLHRTTSAALEWMRFLEAICNGCVVVSEPCLDNEPLLPGEHFVSASVEDIAEVIDGLLDDPDALKRLQQRAYSFVREQLRMRTAGDALVQLAAELPREPPRPASRFSKDARAGHAGAPPHAISETVSGGEPAIGAGVTVAPKDDRPRHLVHRAASWMMRRRNPNAPQILSRTPTYARASPRVTVLSVIGSACEAEAVEALRSVAASEHRDFELLVLDDAASDDAQMVRRLLDAQPSLPAMLLQQRVALGVGRSRNLLAERARGEYLFILEPDAGICSLALERLVGALEDHPEAFFSYSMVGVFEDAKPSELRSALPWEPERLKNGNWIDATALIRREMLLKVGGYSTDPRLAGWEDFELWCKCADAGGCGIHLPEVLAWRRRREDPDTPEMWALMRERFPWLLGAPRAPC